MKWFLEISTASHPLLCKAKYASKSECDSHVVDYLGREDVNTVYVTDMWGYAAIEYRKDKSCNKVRKTTFNKKNNKVEWVTV